MILKTIMEMDPKEAAEAVKNGGATVCVAGLGWMGLPTACLFADAGCRVIGVDVNEHVVEQINKGKSHIQEPGVGTLVKKHVSSGRLLATDSAEGAAAESDIFVIVVPTTVDYRKKPNYSAVEKVSKDIAVGLRRGCLVIFESTVGPGVTEDVVKGVIEKVSGLQAGKDFGLAYSPIRATAGRVLEDLQNYPKVVAGLDERSLELAGAILGTVVKEGVIKVRDIKTAEATKLFENVYRDVNIALANELAMFCEKVGINYMEAREAANTQPYSHLHVPSVGVGGHCIPLNPYFLIDEAEEAGAKVRLTTYARKVNDDMPAHMVKLTAEALRSGRKTLMRAKIAVLGISYRADVKEVKFSPVVEIVKRFLKKGARVAVYDPYFSAKEIGEMGFQGSNNLEQAIEGADCVFVAVGHKRFKGLKLEELARYTKRPLIIVDGSHVFDFKYAKRKEFIYREVGCGAMN